MKNILNTDTISCVSNLLMQKITNCEIRMLNYNAADLILIVQGNLVANVPCVFV